MNSGRLILLVLITSFCYSCSSTRKALNENPVPRSLPTLPASRINIPVRIYVKPLLATMDSMTAKEFTSEKWPNYYQPGCDFRYKYRFVRSPFSFSCINSRVTIGFHGSYQIAGSKTVCAFDKQVAPWVSGSCGFGSEPMRKVYIDISSLIELLPQYQVRSTTNISRLLAPDKCVVSLLQTDITKEIRDSIRASIETYTTSFDHFVASINDNNLLREWRANGNRVFPVSKYGYMNLNPSLLRVGKFNYDKDTLAFSVGFNGMPHFSSDSSSIATKKNLPSFTNSESAPGIASYLDAVYQYTSLSRLLNDSLRNKPFQVEGRMFLLRNINVSGTAQHKLRIQVSFDGNRRGTLHLTGTPVLDTARQALTMPDITFSVDSRDMLLNIAKGLFRKKIMKKLKDQSVFDIAELVKANKHLIEARLNQPVNDWLSTRGTFDELKLVGILAHEDAIQIQLFVRGNITLIGAPTVPGFAGKATTKGNPGR